MQPQSPTDYKQLLTDVIKKQIVILGPDITLSKARNVKGLTISDDGTVTSVEGAPQAVTQALIDQFVQLSGLIVKKTMEPLLSLSQPDTTSTPTAASAPIPEPTVPVAPINPTATVVPVETPTTAMPTPVEVQTTPLAPTDTPVQINASGEAAAPVQTPTPTPEPAPASETPLQPAPTGANAQLEPAKNPLAA